MSNRPSLDDYVDVAERIQNFKTQFPNGSLQTLGWEVVTVDAVRTRPKKVNQQVVAKAGDPVKATFVVYRAAAYRTPDDPAPGHGIAWEPFPGGTPYTEDSELMNAETAAWGRAIIALGLVANRSLASRQEVRNRRADREAEATEPKPSSRRQPAAQPTAPAPSSDGHSGAKDGSQKVDAESLAQLRKVYNESGATDKDLAWFLVSVGVESLPADPSREDIGKAMKELTQEQAWKVKDLLEGKDDSIPGTGEAARDA